jgi:Aspartyl protease
MKVFKGFACLLFAATMASTLPAEKHCPGNAASVPLHLVNRYLLIVAVSVNHSGPYNFLLDTGTQTTAIDPSLANKLHLNTQGAAPVVGVGFQSSASSSQVDLLEVGSHSVANQKVLVFGLQNLQSIDVNVRGVLGEDFLEHFDMLLDNMHNLLCLDETGAMRGSVKGRHIALAPAANGAEIANSLIVVARLSDGMRPVRLWLDSGTNVGFLYNPSKYLAKGSIHIASMQGTGGNAAQQLFSVLAPQNLKIGSLEMENLSFFTPIAGQENPSVTEFDGLLTTWFFKRVFISHADHFTVLQPW